MENLPIWTHFVYALAPGGAVVAASLAALFAWRGHRRQKHAYLDERFWRRLTWAMQQVGSGDVHDANMGMVVLNELLFDKRVQRQEREMLSKLVDNVYARIDEGSFAQESRRERWLPRLFRRVFT